MGRPKVYDERVCTAIRLPTDVRDRLEAAANERDVSMNLLITRAITHYLNQLPNVDELVTAEAPSSGASDQVAIDG